MAKLQQTSTQPSVVLSAMEAAAVHVPEEGWEHLNPMEKASVNAGKAVEEFRNYEDSDRQKVVENHYRMMRTNQTVAFVEKMYKKYHKFDKKQMTIWEAFDVLEGYVDSSDPDTELPNIEHAFQTAEGIRAAGLPDWFQLVGLIHDLGKMVSGLRDCSRFPNFANWSGLRTFLLTRVLSLLLFPLRVYNRLSSGASPRTDKLEPQLGRSGLLVATPG